jgi:hypothetical protein
MIRDKRPLRAVATGNQFEPYYLIGDPYSDDSYRHVPSQDSRSGLEYVTVCGVEFYRYDCYWNQSPYGWMPVADRLK